VARCLLFALTALALVVPGLASASPAAHHAVATGVYGPQTDNQGWVAWSPNPPNFEAPPAPGRIVVLNEATGRRAMVVLPRTCESAGVSDGSRKLEIEKHGR
jgi:hypothetical protein